MSALAPSPTEVAAIAADDRPVLRNLHITRCYSRLAAEFRATVLPAANWCAFATWASKQAGCTIRREDLTAVLRDRLRARAGRRPLLRRFLEDSRVAVPLVAESLAQVAADLPGVERAASAVARGNTKVFEEIGYHFARFLATRPDDEPALDEFSRELRPGDPPDGQRLLASAFAHYARARATADSVIRAQWQLLANLEIGLHEQTRLQPEIQEALDAAVLDVGDLTRRVRDRLARLVAEGGGGARLPFDDNGPVELVAAPLADEVKFVVRAVITDAVKTLALAGGRSLRLGHDLRHAFPPELERLDNPELQTLLAAVDATPDSLAGSGAVDWARLSDRMHFIADFFRGYHEEPFLFDLPFTPAQDASLDADAVPSGPL